MTTTTLHIPDTARAEVHARHCRHGRTGERSDSSLAIVRRVRALVRAERADADRLRCAAGVSHRRR